MKSTQFCDAKALSNMYCIFLGFVMITRCLAATFSCDFNTRRQMPKLPIQIVILHKLAVKTWCQKSSLTLE